MKKKTIEKERLQPPFLPLLASSVYSTLVPYKLIPNQEWAIQALKDEEMCDMIDGV